LAIYFGGLSNKFVRNAEHRDPKVICGRLGRFSVQRIIVRFALFDYFEEALGDIVEFKMGACYGAGVLLVSIFIFRVDSFVVRKINVVALWISINR